MRDLLRYAAFTATPAGGNPAGVVLDATGSSEDEMQETAARVGYSETVFVTAAGTRGGRPHLTVRYFSPAMEVDFCGHATIALGVAYAERHGAGDLVLRTGTGEIGLSVSDSEEGPRATLTSVPSWIAEPAPETLAEALAALDWDAGELAPALPPRVAFGGVRHLVLAAGSRERLADLAYDFKRLEALMLTQEWITLQLVWRENPTLFHSRNPFPVGGVVEDPATGAAAAAFGGYLRDLEQLPAAATFTLIQGEDMGQRSVISVEIMAEGRRLRVSGHACRIG